MTSQTPSFAGCTTYPGGTPILNGGQTSSTGIELISRDGVPNSPFEILDNNVVVSKPNSQFNPYGVFEEQFQGLAQGGHHFQLRANSSSSPTSEWRLTVGAAVPSGPFPVIANPYCATLSPNEARLFVTGSGGVEVYDTSDFKLLARINIAGSSLREIVLNEDGSRAFVADYGTKPGLHIIDAEKFVVLFNVPLPGNAYGVRLSKDESRAFVSCMNSSVAVVDILNAQHMTTITTNLQPTGMDVSPDGQWLYVCTNNGKTVDIIAIATLKLYSSLPLDWVGGDVKVSRDGKHLLVLGFGGAAIFNAVTYVKEKSNSNVAGQTLVLSPDGKRAYCSTSTYDQGIVEIDSETLQVVGRNVTGEWPLMTAIARDGVRGYVPCVRSNEIWPIELSSMMASLDVSALQNAIVAGNKIGPADL